MPGVPDPAMLASLPLFRGLAPEQLEQLNGLLRRSTFPASTGIITVEQPGEILYIILTGTVKVHVEQPDGSEVLIAFGGPGDIEGEVSLLDAEGRSANVTTLEPTSALWLDRATFQSCRHSMPLLADNLARILAGRLRAANARIQALCTLGVEGRVARQLLAFGHEYGRPTPEGAVLIPLRLTQSDLASFVGASRERVNKALNAYKQRGYLDLSAQGHFVLRDSTALERLCR